MKEWSEILGINYDTIRQRWYRVGDKVLYILTAPQKRGKQLEFNGIKMNVSDWSKRTGLSISQIHIRLWHGWSVEKTLSMPIGFYLKKTA